MTNRVTQILGTQYPIVQAPLSWNTDAKLVAAVANAGGMGIFGPNAGKKEPFGDTHKSMDHLRNQVRQARELTDGPIGMNIYSLGVGALEDPYMRSIIDISLEEGVTGFAYIGKVDKELFNYIHDRSGVILFRLFNAVPALAVEAEKAGVDLIVVTGYDEGGSLPDNFFGTFTALPTVANAVTIPVLAAGGVNDRRGVQAAFALGAEGVYMGTRFIATEEAPSAQNVKEAIVASTYEDTVYVAPTLRSIRTPLTDRLMEKVARGEEIDERDLHGGYRNGMLHGDLENGFISISSGIGLIKDIPTVAALVERLFEDTTL